MDVELYNRRRAEQERRKAALALTEAARRIHLELVEIFEARTGVRPAAADESNVIQLRPKGVSRSEVSSPSPRPAGQRGKPGRRRSTDPAASRAG